MTTLEKLKESHRVAQFVLRSIANNPDPDKEYTAEQRTAIEMHALNLANSPSWIGQVIGAYEAQRKED